MPEEYASAEAIADTLIERLDKKIVLALPLGLGKANHIVNALTERALADASIELDIITALTLTLPQFKNDFERRLLEPALPRLFGDYPALRYAELQRQGDLPGNIRVSEFFLQAGQWLGIAEVQRRFIPANYTHALGYLLERGVNVIAQLLAVDENGPDFSLSCNPDITVDLLQRRRDGQCDFLFVGQCNSELPFMAGQARVAAREVDLLLRSEATDFQLFSAPKRPVSLADHAIGLYAARLVRDGGTLQIGIGEIGDAITHALLLRHRDPERFKTLLESLGRPSLTGLEEDGAFVAGLYGLSEMFVDGFLHLAEQGVLKRRVDGAVLHGGFFVDCRDFYRRLNRLSPRARADFQMVPVSFTNELYGDEAGKRRARVKAAFINSAMMVTLRGAVVSDALADGRVVSGVGGQYNFAAQAFALEDARLMITLNASRAHRGETVSNIVWSYGHETLPWHLRDIVITEYGVADLRGRTENEAVKAMLQIADSRFQTELLEQARSAGKIEPGWTIPAAYTGNTPEQLARTLSPAKAVGELPDFPFGSDFNAEERRLLPALAHLGRRAHSRLALARLAWNGLTGGPLHPDEQACLERMGLDRADAPGTYLQRLLLRAGILASRDSSRT
ncbi:MAG: acetyl-CoA hydrolase/transferase C-terminal domain-containing protein [Pseudohongiellaceae bacterium]